MSNAHFEKLNAKINAKFQKAIVASNVDTKKLGRIVDIAQLVLGFIAIAALVKAGLDSHKIIEWRMNDMRSEANWHIVKSLFLLGIICSLMFINFHISDALNADVELMNEIEEI